MSTTSPRARSHRPVNWHVMLALALSSLLIVACGGGDDEDANQVPMTGVAAVATPTVEVARTPTAMLEPTATATSEPTATEVVEISLSIEPSTGTYGTLFSYEFTGLTSLAEYVVATILPDGTEDIGRVTADSSGTYVIAADTGAYWSVGDPLDGWYSVQLEPAGEYVVELRSADRETVLAEDTFTVTEPASAVTPAASSAETPGTTNGSASIRVSPESGSRDELFLFLTAGLTPDQHYELVIRDPNGEEHVEEAVFDENSMELVAVSGPYEGQALSIWGAEPGDPLGEYTVELRDPGTGDVITSSTFTVE